MNRMFLLRRRLTSIIVVISRGDLGAPPVSEAGQSPILITQLRTELDVVQRQTDDLGLEVAHLKTQLETSEAVGC